MTLRIVLKFEQLQETKDGGILKIKRDRAFSKYSLSGDMFKIKAL